jgi:hypothetical protein
VPDSAVAGDQPERQLNQAADEQRDGNQQPDLGVAQAEIGTDKRKGGAFGAVSQLVNELDCERDSNGGGAKIATVAAAAAVSAPTEPTRAGYRSTSHGLMVAHPPWIRFSHSCGRIALCGQATDPKWSGRSGANWPRGSPS